MQIKEFSNGLYLEIKGEDLQHETRITQLLQNSL